MALEQGTLRTAEIVLGQVTDDQKQRARLAIADLARRKNRRAPRRARAVCRELLDMLGLLEVQP